MRKQLLLLPILFYCFNLSGQLQSPDEFLPYQLGEQFTAHHLLVKYFEHVAANSPLVKLTTYGNTNENRPLILAYISTPENLAQLESIRENNLRRAGFLDGEIDPNLDRAIVWISCSVHGNEASGSESSMAILHKLTDPENRPTKDWLENTIVILDPSVNPDGYTRYTSWYRKVSGDQIDVYPSAREHREPWPGGRTNHYYYDLNRDWAWQTQVESQQRMFVYNQWLPHIHADLHEQGVNSPYYFAPAAQPYHKYLTQWQRDFQTTIGKNHAKYFDPKGWLYFTKEVFDLLYPSYGDTYPMFNGSIGMTYEQAGGGRAGRAILMRNGDTLTLADRIDHHVTTSLSTIEIASGNMRSLVENFQEFFSKSKNDPPGKYKSFIVKTEENALEKMEPFCRLLDKNGIRYGTIEESIALPSTYNYVTGKMEATSVNNRDLVISTDQPKGLFTQVLLEPEPELVDSLTYDITAWSLIYAYGLTGYATTERLSVKNTFDFKYPSNNDSSRQREEAYAYFISWESLKDAGFLAQLLKNKITVRFATAAFVSDEGNNFAPGTLVITKGDNQKNPAWVSTLQRLQKQFGQTMFSTTTGFMQEGPDLGSSAYKLIETPKVGLVVGKDSRSNSVGQIWHYFDQEIEYPLMLIETEALDDIPFDDINTLILTDGRYDPEEGREELIDWIREGGHLILIGYANADFEGVSGFSLKEYAEESDENAAERKEENQVLNRRLDHYAGDDRRRISNSIPGAIIKNRMDNTHPLAFGLPNYYFSLKTTNQHYQYLKDTWNVGTLPEELMIKGFVGSKIREALKETVTFAVEEKRYGHITYMVDNPLYRSFWYNGKILFSNAVFLVGN